MLTRRAMVLATGAAVGIGVIVPLVLLPRATPSPIIGAWETPIYSLFEEGVQTWIFNEDGTGAKLSSLEPHAAAREFQYTLDVEATPSHIVIVDDGEYFVKFLGSSTMQLAFNDEFVGLIMTFEERTP